LGAETLVAARTKSMVCNPLRPHVPLPRIRTDND